MSIYSPPVSDAKTLYIDASFWSSRPMVEIVGMAEEHFDKRLGIEDFEIGATHLKIAGCGCCGYDSSDYCTYITITLK